MERIITVTLHFAVPEERLDELRAELDYINAPGSWADGFTTKAFERKWHMTTTQAAMFFGCREMTRADLGL